MTATEIITNLGKGAGAGMFACTVARTNNIRVSSNGVNIHHDLAGIGIVAASAIATVVGLIPKEWGAFGVGAGTAIFIDHLLLEPHGCKGDGVCLHTLSKHISGDKA